MINGVNAGSAEEQYKFDGAPAGFGQTTQITFEPDFTILPTTAKPK